MAITTDVIVGAAPAVALAGLELAVFKPYRAIGPIQAAITIGEDHEDRLTITQHPLEKGANITDHAFKMPARVTIRVAWSSSPNGIPPTTPGSLSQYAVPFTGGIIQIYSNILELQASRIPFTLYTGKRIYPNMLMESVSEHTDEKTENGLFLTIRCQQIIIVSTTQVNVEATPLQQASPEQTENAENAGSKIASEKTSVAGKIGDYVGGLN